MDEQPSRSATSLFPAGGDNFRTVGTWRILSGAGWHKWQASAVAAEIAASRARGDVLNAARQARTLRAGDTGPAARPAPPRAMD